LELKAGQDGTAQIYIANETAENLWFDDLKILS
jgi:hypothetical protein